MLITVAHGEAVFKAYLEHSYQYTLDVFHAVQRITKVIPTRHPYLPKRLIYGLYW